MTPNPSGAASEIDRVVCGTHVNNIRAHGVMVSYVGRCVSVGAHSPCVTLSCVIPSVCFGVRSPGDMTGSNVEPVSTSGLRLAYGVQKRNSIKEKSAAVVVWNFVPMTVIIVSVRAPPLMCDGFKKSVFVLKNVTYKSVWVSFFV